MKRFFVFSLALLMLLVSASVYADTRYFEELNIDAYVPTGWSAQIDSITTIRGVSVPLLQMVSDTDPSKWFWVFIDYKTDANGNALSLWEVGKQFRNRLDGIRVDTEDNENFYAFSFTVSNTSVLFRLGNLTVRTGQYSGVAYPFEHLTDYERDVIMYNIKIYADDKRGGDNNNSSSGGGGCNSGTGLFASMAIALSALIFRKK